MIDAFVYSPFSFHMYSPSPQKFPMGKKIFFINFFNYNQKRGEVPTINY
jgi:hypothetical protein